MVDAEVEGDKLNELEIATFFVLLMSAGNDSTRATYSADDAGVAAQPRGAAISVREHPELIEAAVEEGLRCYPAFAFMARAATKDIELHGKTIKENDRLLLWYIASNRDETRVRKSRASSTSPGPGWPTSTRRSVVAASTSAWAPTSPASS